MPTFNNSYIITNRQTPSATSYDNIVPLSGGEMWFYTAPKPYDAEVSDYASCTTQPQTAAPQNFLDALTADLNLQGANPQLTILIHGLGNVFSDAIALLSRAGKGLATYGKYPGLVIAFDWPSYDEFDSGLDYASSADYPPTATSGTIRDNINGTTAAFVNLLAMLTELQGKIPTLDVNVLCHSEGNYMFMLGNYVAATQQQSFNFAQTLMLAADVNNGVFQTVGLNDGYTGRGVDISNHSARVTVYYSSNDTVLSGAETTYESYHDEKYYGRLGQAGPVNYLTGDLVANAIGLDCSAVVNALATQHIVPPTVTLHSSYFYIPQVLADLAATLNGSASGTIANRESAGAQNGNQYLMLLDSSSEAKQSARAANRTGAGRQMP